MLDTLWHCFQILTNTIDSGQKYIEKKRLMSLTAASDLSKGIYLD